MPYVLGVILLVLFNSVAFAQTATVRIEVRSDKKPVAEADVVVNGVTNKTDSEGVVRVSVPPDLPMRVEVLDREEIEEKMLMTPGDIVMMLNETGGLRVQATSPSLGAASVRIQGMRARYTRFLSDGLPLFGEVGGLGLLQIPPMDLGQVEVIKGVASALYGAGAMGGVVNLLSRRPTDEPIREALVNRSTRGATDTAAFVATPLSEHWRVSLLGGGHWQQLTDVDDDAWADLPKYARGVLRPRLFYDGGTGRTFFATVGVTYEDRVGGTTGAAFPSVIGGAYREALETLRVDAGAVGQVLFRNRHVLTARAAMNRQRHDHRFGDVRERDRHRTTFGEVALRGAAGRHTWVLGTALERDGYDPRDLPQFAYTFTIPGVFMQDDFDVARWLSVSASGRLDHHSEYGTFFSPRLSALLRSGGWTTRLSAGTGFFGPTSLTEETEATGLSRLRVPRPLVAERGRSASLDITRTAGPATLTATLFASRVKNPIDVDRSTGFVLSNLSDPTTNTGVELLGDVHREPFALVVSYMYVRSRESEVGRRVDVSLTPRHSAGLVAMWESEGEGRLSAEVFYTGRQRLDNNLYRNESKPYWFFGMLAERRIGRFRVFVNAENLTDVRQTRFDPLVRPHRDVDGRWTVDAWAPVEGRVLNGGMRVEF